MGGKPASDVDRFLVSLGDVLRDISSLIAADSSVVSAHVAQAEMEPVRRVMQALQRSDLVVQHIDAIADVLKHLGSHEGGITTAVKDSRVPRLLDGALAAITLSELRSRLSGEAVCAEGVVESKDELWV